ncbi:MAG: hypothetical protein ACYDGU_07440 [Acidiferrobacterales bacterium]
MRLVVKSDERDLHPLKGERTGGYALSVNGPWRLAFRVEQGGFTCIRLEQYY